MNSKSMLGKLFLFIFLIYAITTVSFVIIRSMPGDPLMNILGEEEYYFLLSRNPQGLEEIRERYKLDGNMFNQYIKYMGRILRLDFGYSYSYGMPVTTVVTTKLRWTLLLTMPSTIFAALIGGFLGLKNGYKPGLPEKFLTPSFFVLNSIPSYCIGILALYFIAFRTGWFPVAGMASTGNSGWSRVLDTTWHMALPLSILILLNTAYNYLIMKNSVQLVNKEDFIITARSKGLPESIVLHRHVKRNALAPYITNVFMQFGYAMTGVMTLEIVFSWQGMGKLMSSAAFSKDYPILQLSFLLLCISVMATNILADFVAAWIDPRIRDGKEF